jgi:hypothetical protein
MFFPFQNIATEVTEKTEHNDQMKKEQKTKSDFVDLPAVLSKNIWLPLRALRSLR